MKQKIITLLFTLLLPISVLAADGDEFTYANGHYRILSEANLTAVFLGFNNTSDTHFFPTVERNGKQYDVTEIRKEGFNWYFNCDFTNYPPSQYKVKVIGDEVFRNTSVDPNKLPSV